LNELQRKGSQVYNSQNFLLILEKTGGNMRCGSDSYLLGAGCHYIRPFPLVEGIISVQAISWVIEHSKHSLGNFIVLLMVANHAKSDGTGAWPSVDTLARESRLSERETRYCLRALEQSGELQTKFGKGPHGTNIYNLPLVRGANSAPRGAICNTGGGNLRHKGGQSTAPEPSLTVLKDKERPGAGIRADYSSTSLSGMTQEEWEAHLDRIDPKRRKKA
jgi:hypothetical protein